jgi:hypothetical protein
MEWPRLSPCKYPDAMAPLDTIAMERGELGVRLLWERQKCLEKCFNSNLLSKAEASPWP